MRYAKYKHQQPSSPQETSIPRKTFGFSLELLADIPEFGPRIAEIERLLAEDAATYEGALPQESESDSGVTGAEVYSYTPMKQGYLSRKVLQEQGVQLLDNGTQTYVWVGDELKMTGTLEDGRLYVQRFRKATDSLYIATTIDDWNKIPVEGEFFVKVVIMID